MPRPTRRRLLFLLVLVAVWAATLAWLRPAYAGGPLIVGSSATGFNDAVPFVWNTATEIPYRTDGPLTLTAIALGTLTKAQADARVTAMFQVWEDVPTSSIGFTRAPTSSGNIKSVGAVFTDGDVTTVNEYNAVVGTCGDERLDAGKQSPIIYDRDGTLFGALGQPSSVIGFASPCDVAFVGGVNRITGGFAALNGKWIDGNPAFELTPDEFDQAFTHEFGHFAGLDHSQINLNVLSQGVGTCTLDDTAGLPLMFPILHCQARVSSGLPPLAPDDIAWISFLYPAGTFSTTFGRIDGRIFFSDGQTQLQGANVIARQVDDPATLTVNESKRNAVSVVSGYLFTGNPGQSVTCIGLSCTNVGGDSFGSRDPTLIGFYEIPATPATGDYTVEIESIDPGFVAGSRVGPMLTQIPLPGPPEFFDGAESATDNPADSTPILVTAGGTVSGSDIVVNGTPDRFDIFESARLWLPEPQPGWLRERWPAAFRVTG
ncbi:MAG: hypothetical protein ACRD35_05400 [Candidatus Acidiferrales bacterium]